MRTICWSFDEEIVECFNLGALQDHHRAYKQHIQFRKCSAPCGYTFSFVQFGVMAFSLLFACRIIIFMLYARMMLAVSYINQLVYHAPANKIITLYKYKTKTFLHVIKCKKKIPQQKCFMTARLTHTWSIIFFFLLLIYVLFIFYCRLDVRLNHRSILSWWTHCPVIRKTQKSCKAQFQDLPAAFWSTDPQKVRGHAFMRPASIQVEIYF